MTSPSDRRFQLSFTLIERAIAISPSANDLHELRIMSRPRKTSRRVAGTGFQSSKQAGSLFSDRLDRLGTSRTDALTRPKRFE